MNDARNSMRDDRGRRGGEKTLIFFCSSRVRVCARIFDARARENFVIRRRLGNFETMAPLPSHCARAFSRTHQPIQTPMEFRSCPREFDEKVVREKTGEQERELVFPLSFFLLFSIARRLLLFVVLKTPTSVLTNVCFGVGWSKKRAWRRCAHKYVSTTISPVRNWKRCGEKGISFS